jgi:hypothetical protein
MGSFEETYDDDELRSFKPTQLKKLQELHVQLDNKFKEIVELLAHELNHAKNDPRVHDEAERLALAKLFCRKIDRIDPTGMSRPFRHTGRSAPASDSRRICRLL